MKKTTTAFALLFLGITSYSQSVKPIIIETKNTALVYTVGSNGRLYQSYVGKHLTAPDDYLLLKNGREAYPGAGMDNMFESAIRIIHNDGNPSLELKYVNTTVQEAGNIIITNINLKDPVYPVEVTMHIAAYREEDIIKTWVDIKHHEKNPITLTNYASSFLHFDASAYWLSQFHGEWAREVRMEESKLTSGIKIIDSKLGTRGDMYQSPVFFLSLNKQSKENEGELIAGTLAWTGNFQFMFELDQRNGLNISSGINPYASEYKLDPDKIFTTPEFIFTYSNAGKGQASRNLHKWARNYAVMDGTKPRLTLLNNWETTDMNFNQQQLVELFDGAKQLGVDLFLLDDGWFGNKYHRDNDKAGLGDWQEDKRKLPDGISYLVKEADKKGIKFGIWLEPEMVNPKSELYEKHPDWILKLPNRDENYYRNQLVLDLINPAVQDFVYNLVDSMFIKNPGLAYIKWDCNRPMTNTYSPYLKEKQSNLFIDYVESLYKVLARIRAKYPHIPMMLCSGGGGRTDYEGLKYFTEFWASDNTDPLERAYIQWGYSYFFPANTISSHITSWNKQASLKFKTDVAMSGKLGYDIKVSSFTPDELKFSTQAVTTYKNISNVVWFGDLYRLVSPYEENRSVIMYVDEHASKAVLFNYLLSPRYNEIFDKVKLQGLDANKKYRIQEINLFPGTKSGNPNSGKVFTGDYLMTVGLNVIGGRVAPMTSNVYEINEEQ